MSQVKIQRWKNGQYILPLGEAMGADQGQQALWRVAGAKHLELHFTD